MKKLTRQAIAIAYEQRRKRTEIAIIILHEHNWYKDFCKSDYRSPVTYLRHRHGITWEQYYPAWGGIMYTKYGK